MRVFKKVVISMASLAVIACDVAEENYQGPVAQCGGGDAGGGGDGGGYGPAEEMDPSEAFDVSAQPGGLEGVVGRGAEDIFSDGGRGARDQGLFVVPPSEQPTTSVWDAAVAGARVGGPYMGVLSGTAVALDRALGNENPRDLASQSEPAPEADQPGPGPAPAPAPAPRRPSRAEVEGTVGSLYTELLGRQADPGGLAAWTEEIMSGRMSVDAVRNAIYNSGEGQAYREPRQSVSVNRAPQPTGLIEPGAVEPPTFGADEYDNLVGSLLLTALEEEELLREGRTGRRSTLLSGDQGILNRPRLRRSRLLGVST